MKKHFLFLLTGFILFSSVSHAQNVDVDPNRVLNDAQLSKRAFKVENPGQDKTDVFDITGIGGASFTASNTADGSANSYSHALRITLPLITSNKKENYQLVFYSQFEKIPFAVATEVGVTSIYFPASVYDDIRQKLEQAITARKKIQLKVTMKTNGFREGVLIF